MNPGLVLKGALRIPNHRAPNRQPLADLSTFSQNYSFQNLHKQFDMILESPHAISSRSRSFFLQLKKSEQEHFSTLFPPLKKSDLVGDFKPFEKY